jgi:hypothetical protein
MRSDAIRSGLRSHFGSSHVGLRERERERERERLFIMELRVGG